MAAYNPVGPTALSLPIFKKLANRRVVLASASPRRKEIFANAGFFPEIIPSTFAEDLPHSRFQGHLADYPIATGAEKAMEVYERLVKQDAENPPDLVISADTVVVFPPEKDTAEGGSAHGEVSEILEKPINKDEQARSLGHMSGRKLYPTVEYPGFKVHSISCSTLVKFYDNTPQTIQAYVNSNEGIDRAGGFAIQGLGGILIEGIEGNYDNCVGFPSAPFWRWMSELDADGVFDEAWE
ncbi:septum formation protein Maf [Cryptococcus deuterogattii 99/473]|uniref:Septum formation protein Maf n=1 Tax=Cryptococcus deuterogattii Ram5 TaxID=1296110 RepID=A0A0D0TWC2_9TREE|nr:septum formation protein Maf [Cryptococcus deuterogattii MMRL2647]KIR40118.1 septum formation protein Maf [Cryptococcus deuterogattii Ram5]KIR71512.1 septum formation protein Maf [Cryptococcus deuterogattii CA1014]KIR96445.1 septum formation protein Maf [Cryptococcus deuterogattii 2001/935-1]KIY55843.1 septum formation protein Maf [Cryptococcus deuterogattii 99/473]